MKYLIYSSVLNNLYIVDAARPNKRAQKLRLNDYGFDFCTGRKLSYGWKLSYLRSVYFLSKIKRGDFELLGKWRG